MKKRIIKKERKIDVRAIKHKYLECESCGTEVFADINAVSVMCSKCFMKRIPCDTTDLKPQSSGRPVGWKFMKVFVDKDGTVYHSGEEQPKLKGKLPPTDVESIKKQQKEKRALNKEKKVKKEKRRTEKMIKDYQKKQKIKKQIKEKKKEAMEKLLKK